MTDIYQWFVELNDSIKTEGFFQFTPVTNSATDDLREVQSVCPDYAEFIRRFGSARLVQHPHRIFHEIHVNLPIRQTDGSKNVLEIGYADWKELFCTPRDPLGTLWEGDGKPRKIVRAGFAAWLQRNIERAVKGIKPEIWKEILQGPAPFNQRELEIVFARTQFSFQKVGVTPEGKVKVLVTNNSETTLRYLSVGVLVPKVLEGRSRLPVGNIAPGDSAVIEASMYSGTVAAEDIELYPLPPPGPQDRKRYSELGEL